MHADRDRTLLIHAATELTTGGRLSLAALATATGLSLEEVSAGVEDLAGRGLVEVEDGAIVQVTGEGLAEVQTEG